jgi:hypothetical protein
VKVPGASSTLSASCITVQIHRGTAHITIGGQSIADSILEQFRSGSLGQGVVDNEIDIAILAVFARVALYPSYKRTE